jgi:presenilin-like A22 family membrane protease
VSLFFILNFFPDYVILQHQHQSDYDVAFDNFRQKIIQKLSKITYLLFLYITRRSTFLYYEDIIANPLTTWIDFIFFFIYTCKLLAVTFEMHWIMEIHWSTVVSYLYVSVAVGLGCQQARTVWIRILKASCQLALLALYKRNKWRQIFIAQTALVIFCSPCMNMRIYSN